MREIHDTHPMKVHVDSFDADGTLKPRTDGST